MRKAEKICLYSLYLTLILLLTACSNSKRPDIGDSKISVKIQRFEEDLYLQRDKNVNEAVTFLKKKYGVFFDDFIHRMVGTPNLSPKEVLEILYRQKAYTDLQKETDSVFTNFKALEESLSGAFSYIHYYYPKAPIPQFISFISGFAYQIPVGENYIGIGLDMFLGKDSKSYPALIASIPLYQSRRFEPVYITPRVTEEYARQELFPVRDEDRSLLSQMIYNGKILYFMDKVLPETVNDTLKIGYTGRQLAWAKHFEGNIWAVLLEESLIFNSDFQKIHVYLTDGPFTPGLGDKGESAPKLGIWIGWQIVKKYMQENPQVTLQELMANTDAQKILTKARYKPKIIED